MELDAISSLFEQKRADFPILQRTVHGKPFVYLDNAATSLKPRVLISALRHFYENEYATIHRSVYLTAVEAEQKYHKVREHVAKFLSAKRSEEIVFCRGTTDAVNLVAHSFGKAHLKKGDVIIVSAMEHHSNLLPWQMLCQEKGAELKIASVDESGCLDLQALQKLLDERVKLLAVCHVSNVLGSINPIQKIVQMAHQCGAKVFVDGAQAPAHIEVNVQELEADFYAFSAHKLYGPTGLGFLYARYDLLCELPPYQGGGDMIQKVDYEKSTYAEPPLKFEAGTPMIAQVIAFGAVLDYLSCIDYQALSAYEGHLLSLLLEGLSQISGLKIIGSLREKAPIVTFTVDCYHPLDIASMLDLKGIAIRSGHHCAQPLLKRFSCETAARVSLGMYNTKAEVLFFVDSLKEVLSVLSK